MLEILLYKFLLLLFILSILNIIRHIWFFISSYVRETKFKISGKDFTNKDLLILGISVSYFFTIMFSGFLK